MLSVTEGIFCGLKEPSEEKYVAEEHHASDLYLMQQADNAARRGFALLLSKLSPGLHLALRAMQEVLEKIQVHQLQL